MSDELDDIPDALAELVFGTAAAVLDRRVAAEEGPRRARQYRGLEEWSRNYLPKNFRDPPSDMHRWCFTLADASRERRGMKINLLGPRGGAKSTVWTLAHVLRSALEGWEANIWIVSETGDQAEDALDNIREQLTESEHLAAAYPDAWGKGPVWRRSKIRLRNGVTIAAFGKGVKIRGRRAGADRPTLIVADDVQGDQAMTSADLRNNDWTWFNGSLLNAGDKRTNVVNLATALHRDAIALRLHRTPGWTSRVFQAIVRWPDNMSLWHQWEEIYNDVGNPQAEADADRWAQRHMAELTAGCRLLWPQREDLLTLMKLRVERGRSEFEREKQGRPVNPEDCEWPEEYFDESIWFDDWPRECQIKVMALDPSKGKDAKRSDFSAFVWGMYAGGCFYVDADLARRPPKQIVEDGVRLYRAFRPHVFGVEANAMQELFLDQFEREFLRHDERATVAPIFNQGNKVVRIRTLGARLGARQVKFRRGSEGVLELIRQLRDFPDPKSHDDGPDALEMMIAVADQWLRESRSPGIDQDHYRASA